VRPVAELTFGADATDDEGLAATTNITLRYEFSVVRDALGTCGVDGGRVAVRRSPLERGYVTVI
jgi:hypothetical protein